LIKLKSNYDRICNKLLINAIYIYTVHGKNGFTKIFKNLTRYRSKNNFVGPSK